MKGASWIQYAGRAGTWLLSTGSILPGAASTVAIAPQNDRSVTFSRLANGVPEVDGLSSDGRCVAVWHTTAEGYGLAVGDLVLGTQRELVTLESTTTPVAAVWSSAR